MNKLMLDDKQPIKAENEKLKSLLDKLETEKSDISSLYERLIL